MQEQLFILVHLHIAHWQCLMMAIPLAFCTSGPMRQNLCLIQTTLALLSYMVKMFDQDYFSFVVIYGEDV